LTAALAFRPDFDSARYLRGLASSRLQHWAEAVDDFTRLLDRDPDHPAARSGRAAACYQLRRFADAMADYTILLERSPADGALYRLRAQCYDALGEAEKARADRDKAAGLGSAPTAMELNSQAWRLVNGPAAERDLARALELIQTAIKLEPNNAHYLNTLGVVQ